MKTSEEMTESVLRRIQTEKSENKQKRKRYIISCCLTLCIAAGAAAAGALHGRQVQTAASVDTRFGSPAQNQERCELPASAAKAEAAAEQSGTTFSAAAKSAPTQTTRKAEAACGTPEESNEKSADGYGAGQSKVRTETAGTGGITPGIMNLCVKLKGEVLTKEAGAAHIKENAPSIASALRADPIIGAGELQFSTVGYRHLTVSEEEGLFVNTAFADYPVFRNNEVIGVVTVYMDNGKIYSSPAYGGTGFAVLNKALDADPDSDVVFLYRGEVPEVFITENNTFFFNPCSIPVENGFDYYTFFKGNGNEANKTDMLASAVTVK